MDRFPLAAVDEPKSDRLLVHPATDIDPFSEALWGQLQGARSQEWRPPFQERATPQMAPQRLARREPPGCASSALQLLPRAPAIAGELRLDLAHPGGSEWVNICGGVH